MKPAPRNNRSASPPTPEEIKKGEEALKRAEEWMDQIRRDREEQQREQRRNEEILTFLGIPFLGNSVEIKALVDILMDEEKVKVILTKVRNKAFW